MLSDHQTKPWLHVREQLGVQPIISQQLSAPFNIHIERYMCQARNFIIKPLPYPILIVHFGGSKVTESSEGQQHGGFLPGYSALVPANQETEWIFTGFIDFTTFYFLPDTSDSFSQLIIQHCRESTELIPVSDSLIAAISKEISNELFQQNNQELFIERLVIVLLDKVWRMLNAEDIVKINPKYIQQGRIQKVLTYIQKNMHEQLTIEGLAAQIGLSQTHFRRIFLDATGRTPYQFVNEMKLKQAKEWLINSEMPIITISTELGFSSQSHFTANFKQALGISPAKYRQLFVSS